MNVNLFYLKLQYELVESRVAGFENSVISNDLPNVIRMNLLIVTIW